MSKPGVNITPTKQDNNLFKKENRNQNSGNNSNVKDDRRSSGGFNSGPGNQQGRGNQNNASQNSQQHERDRSANRNDNKQFDQKPVIDTEKTTDKDDKIVDSGSAPGVPAPGEKNSQGDVDCLWAILHQMSLKVNLEKCLSPTERCQKYMSTHQGVLALSDLTQNETKG
ncbi:hypothetical protein Btru_056072 [Bulinus truncatus]|nr:hypothetical protein Btru_056072 [Bulinus truncatus]